MNTEQTDATLALLVSQGFSPTILTRFWAKVQKSQEPNGCWLWTGATNGAGHGKITTNGHNGRHDYAHRISWMIANGAVPDGLHVLHNCPGGDNPACVNPAHLWLGSHKSNMEDMVKKGRAHGGYKLNDQIVAEIRALRPIVSGKELASRYGVSQSTISQVCNGQRHSRSLPGSDVPQSDPDKSTQPQEHEVHG